MEVSGGLQAAQLVADENGFVLLGQVLTDSDLYHFKEKRHSKRSAEQTEKSLSESTNVKSATQQKVLKVRCLH